MAVKNTIQEPFSDIQVFGIMLEEIENGTDNLKERVTARTVEVMGINDGRLPERVRAWVNQYCMAHTARIPFHGFKGKNAEPIDLASLPNRSR